MPLDCIRLPQLLFPAPGVDLTRFAVIACDQFTAEPSYWAHAAQLVGDVPSCLHLTLPEAWLTEDDSPRTRAIRSAYWASSLASPRPEKARRTPRAWITSSS